MLYGSPVFEIRMSQEPLQVLAGTLDSKTLKGYIKLVSIISFLLDPEY